jgi:virginiamycin B lyase
MPGRFGRLALVLVVLAAAVAASALRDHSAASGKGLITLYPQASNVWPETISGTASGDLWYGGLVTDGSGGHPHLWRITTGGGADGDFVASGGTGDVRQVAAAPSGGAYFTEAWSFLSADGRPGGFINSSGTISGPGTGNRADAVAYGNGQVYWGGVGSFGGAAVWSGYSAIPGPLSQGPDVLGNPIHALVTGPSPSEVISIAGTRSFNVAFLGTNSPCPINSLPSDAQLVDVTYQPANTFWVADAGRDSIWRETGPCSFTEYSVPDGTAPRALTAGVDGNLYFTTSSGLYGLVPSNGGFIHYTDPDLVDPQDITSGSDGNIWFADRNGHQIGKLDISPVIGFDSIRFAPLPIDIGGQGVIGVNLDPGVGVVDVHSTNGIFVPGTGNDPGVPENLRSDCPPLCYFSVKVQPAADTHFGAQRGSIDFTLSTGDVISVEVKAVLVPSTPGHH